VSVAASNTTQAGHAQASQAPPGRVPPDRPWLALAITVTCTLMLILDATVMNVALPRIQADLHFSSTQLSWVLSAYTLTFGGLLLLGGRAGDIFGRRRLFIGGVALFTVASLVGGLAPTAGWLLAARVLQGVGAAAAGPNTIALIATAFTDARERVRALALMSAVAGGGFAIGLILGGVLTEFGSWRWVLFINVPFGIVAVLLAPRFIPVPARHPARVDLIGAPVATLSVGSLVYGLLHAASDGWSNATTVVPLAIGVVGLISFVLLEARVPAPLLPLRLFADRNRAAGYVNFFLGPVAMMSTFFFLTQFLQNIRHYSALQTGFAFLPMAVGMFGMTRVVPRLLGRLGPRRLTMTGSVLMTVGLLWLTRLTPSTAYFVGVLGPMALLGLGGGLGFVPLTPVIMGSVPPEQTGSASGVLQTMQQLGSTVGLAVLVTVFGAATHGTAHDPAAVTHGMTVAFTVAAAIAGVTFLVALNFRRPGLPGAGPAARPSAGAPAAPASRVTAR